MGRWQELHCRYRLLYPPTYSADRAVNLVRVKGEWAVGKSGSSPSLSIRQPSNPAIRKAAVEGAWTISGRGGPIMTTQQQVHTQGILGSKSILSLSLSRPRGEEINPLDRIEPSDSRKASCVLVSHCSFRLLQLPTSAACARASPTATCPHRRHSSVLSCPVLSCKSLACYGGPSIPSHPVPSCPISSGSYLSKSHQPRPPIFAPLSLITVIITR